VYLDNHSRMSLDTKDQNLSQKKTYYSVATDTNDATYLRPFSAWVTVTMPTDTEYGVELLDHHHHVFLDGRAYVTRTCITSWMFSRSTISVSRLSPDLNGSFLLRNKHFHVLVKYAHGINSISIF